MRQRDHTWWYGSWASQWSVDPVVFLCPSICAKLMSVSSKFSFRCSFTVISATLVFFAAFSWGTVGPLSMIVSLRSYWSTLSIFVSRPLPFLLRQFTSLVRDVNFWSFSESIFSIRDSLSFSWISMIFYSTLTSNLDSSVNDPRRGFTAPSSLEHSLIVALLRTSISSTVFTLADVLLVSTTICTVMQRF